MIIIKKRYLNFLFSLIILLILTLSITSFIIIKNVDLTDIIEKKYYAETIIYISILIIIIVSLFYFSIINKSIKILKELNKLSNTSKYGKYDYERAEKKLGELGKNINNIFFLLNRLNEQKSIKISSLSNITNFLLNNIELSILIVDIEGFIVHCSKFFNDKFEIPVNLILYNNITIIKNINFQDIIYKLEKSHECIGYDDFEFELYDKKYKYDILFYPIFNINKQLSDIIFIFEKNFKDSLKKYKIDQVINQSKEIKKIFNLF